MPEPSSGGGTLCGLEMTLENLIKGDFWETQGGLTGDNLRERPYSNIYPKVCTRSNVYTVHLIAQTVKKAEGGDHKYFNSVTGTDSVTAEWRGSAMVERILNPEDPEIVGVDFVKETLEGLDKIPRVDEFYTYRVTEVKQLSD